MRDKITDIEQVLRNAISARQADTPPKRRLIYEAAERALERSLTAGSETRDPAQAHLLRDRLQTAIDAIETGFLPHEPVFETASMPVQPREDVPMTDTTTRMPPDPSRGKSSRGWLPIAAIVLVAIAAGAGWFAYTMNKGPANVATHARAGELLDESYSSALAKLTLDPKVLGYVDGMFTDTGDLTLTGWVVDNANYEVPVSVLAYAGEDLIGAAGAKGKRPDLKIAGGDPDAAFKLAAGGSCPKGTALNVIGVTSDGRYAPMKFFQMEAVCP